MATLDLQQVASPSRRPLRRYLASLACAAGLALLLVAGANAVVDPWQLFPGDTAPALDDYRVGRGDRTWKAGAIERVRPRTLIVGTSRAEVGLDPTHEALGALPALNCALAGSFFYETRRVIDFALERSDVDLIVIGLDYSAFAEGGAGAADFARSAFNPATSAAQRLLEALISQRALDTSFATVTSWARDRPALTTNRGFRPVIARPVPHPRKRTSQMIRREAEQRRLSGKRITAAERVGPLRETLRTCVRQGVETVLLMPPVHALYLERRRMLGEWEDYEAWKREVIRIAHEVSGRSGAEAPVRVYDFSGYNAYTTEPMPPAGDPSPMQWYWEFSHYKAELGDLMLERGVGGAPKRGGDSFGALLDPSSIERHLALIRREREAWAASASTEIEWLRSLMEPSGRRDE